MLGSTSEWNRQLEERLRTIEGQTLVGVEIEEMALFEEGPNGFPLFEHPDFPFIQAQRISLAFQNGRMGFLRTQQNDDTFGIYFDWTQTPFEELHYDNDETSIYRRAPNPVFPLGLITEALPFFDSEGDLTMLTLKIDQSTVILFCAELEEGYNWSYIIREKDESILVFENQKAFESVSFGIEAVLSSEC